MTLSPRSTFAPLVALAVMATLTGCQKSQTKTEVKVTSEKVAEAPTAASLDAKLVAADAADGTTDKVVSKCAGCGLGMMGKPDHAVTVRGYEMHFCSESCQARCEKDPDAMVKSLPIN